MSAYTVRELAELARRADNLALLEGLPDHDVDLDGMLDDLTAGPTGT